MNDMKQRPRTRPPLPLLTAAAFDRAAAKTTLSTANLERAREVLVDGRRVIEVADDTGVSRQRIYQIVQQMLAEF